MNAREVYVVFGGAGFLGCHLVEELLRLERDVICFDNFSTGQKQNLDGSRALARERGVELQVREIDVCSDVMRTVTRRMLEGRKLVGVVNLACPASPIAYKRDPLGTLDVCYLGTRNALEIARDNECKVLHASTSEVYGDPDAMHHPQREDYWGNVNPWGERSMYDEGKRVSEALCREFLLRGTDVRVVRIFNTFGDRMAVNDGRVVSEFIMRALRGEEIQVNGDGQQTRSLCHVSDMIDGFVRMLSVESPNGTPINLGNPEEMTVNEIARHVLELVPESTSKVVHVAASSDDPRQRCPDIALAREFLGWSPRIAARTGLELTVEHFRRTLQRGQI